MKNIASYAGNVARSNLSRNVVKSRGWFYFSSNLQRNTLLHCKLRKRGFTRAIVFATCTATFVALQVAEKIASCNMALKGRAKTIPAICLFFEV